MASLGKFSLLFSLLILFLCKINPALSNPETQGFIDQICRQMEDYGFCNRTFNENLKTPSTNIEGLTQIALEQTIEHVSSTYTYAESALDNATAPEVEDIISECIEDYESIINGFMSAFMAFGDKNYKEMLALENPAPKAIGTCESSMSFKPSPVMNPLIERNRVLRILIQMSIFSGHLLAGG